MQVIKMPRDFGAAVQTLANGKQFDRDHWLEITRTQYKQTRQHINLKRLAAMKIKRLNK